MECTEGESSYITNSHTNLCKNVCGAIWPVTESCQEAIKKAEAKLRQHPVVQECTPFYSLKSLMSVRRNMQPIWAARICAINENTAGQSISKQFFRLF